MTRSPAIPANLRWPAGVLVLLLHILAVGGLLLVDHLRPAPPQIQHATQWVRLPEIPHMPPPLQTRPITGLQAPQPRLALPEFDMAITAKPSGPGAITLQPGQTLDLTVRKPKEDLVPSPEKRRREEILRFEERKYLDGQRELAADPNDRCHAIDQSGDRFKEGPRNGVSGEVKLWSDCRDMQSLKAQQMRNDRYSPH
jgi:hypothetical protein